MSIAVVRWLVAQGRLVQGPVAGDLGGQPGQEQLRPTGRRGRGGEILQYHLLLPAADAVLPAQRPQGSTCSAVGTEALQQLQPLQRLAIAAQADLIFEAAAVFGIEQVGVLHPELLLQPKVLIVADAQGHPHLLEHRQAAGGVDEALLKGLPHHPLVGLQPFLAGEARQHLGQHIDLVGVEVVEGPAV